MTRCRVDWPSAVFRRFFARHEPWPMFDAGEWPSGGVPSTVVSASPLSHRGGGGGFTAALALGGGGHAR